MASAIEMPFLYHTRTILRRNPRVLRWASRSLHNSPRRSNIDDTLQHESEASSPSFLQEKAQEAAGVAKSKQHSTITGPERQVFRALRSLRGQPLPERQRRTAPLDELFDTNPENILKLFSNSVERTHERPETESGLNEDQAILWRTFKPVESASLMEEGVQALEEVAKAQSQSQPSPQSAINLESTEATVNRITLAQMSKISTAFQEAIKSPDKAGDLALWDALHKHVFPLIHHLKAATDLTKAQRKSANAALPLPTLVASTSTSTSSPTPATSIPPNPSLKPKPKPKSPHASPNPPPSLPILTRLYPSALLLALRLFATRFPLSPLSASLIPTIHALGPASYVLGANTHLYNSVLHLRWTVYSSLREVDGLLAEMERGTVEFDVRTWRILRGIVDERGRDLGAARVGVGRRAGTGGGERDEEVVVGGVLGPRGAEWWRRAEQATWFARIEEWMGLIARRLEAQGFGEVLREGTYEHGLQDAYTGGHPVGNLHLGKGTTAREMATERPAVWL